MDAANQSFVLVVAALSVISIGALYFYSLFGDWLCAKMFTRNKNEPEPSKASEVLNCIAEKGKGGFY